MPYIPSLCVNINDSVWVRLTDAGRRIHREHHEELSDFATNNGGHPIPYEPPPEIDGFCKFQLWMLMDIFGYHVGAIPFQDNCIYLVKP